MISVIRYISVSNNRGHRNQIMVAFAPVLCVAFNMILVPQWQNSVNDSCFIDEKLGKSLKEECLHIWRTVINKPDLEAVCKSFGYCE